MTKNELSRLRAVVSEALTLTKTLRKVSETDVMERQALDALAANFDTSASIISVLAAEAGGKANDTARSIRLLSALSRGDR
jgi:hypothetical protein